MKNTLTRFRKKCISENNEVRVSNGLDEIKIKVRKCNMCGSDFESSAFRTCPRCRKKKNKIAETTDLDVASQFDW